ncbi:hypothetical protein [Vibrio coralliilyticus]|uniref:hypothetical protein n=1 Tax=Vibrio coralliilyticus TaxID=190893 RepID=UPI00210E2339|nr:hypothetical protein [Vibrio coralliilyticus]
MGGNLNTATLVFYYFSYFVFIYALVSALASVIALFTVSYWYDDYQSKDIGGKIKKMLAAEEEERKLRQKVADLQKKLEEGKT